MVLHRFAGRQVNVDLPLVKMGAFVENALLPDFLGKPLDCFLLFWKSAVVDCFGKPEITLEPPALMEQQTTNPFPFPIDAPWIKKEQIRLILPPQVAVRVNSLNSVQHQPSINFTAHYRHPRQ